MDSKILHRSHGMLALLQAFERCEASYFRGRHSALPDAGVFFFEEITVCRRPHADFDFNKISGVTDATVHKLAELEALFAPSGTRFAIETTPNRFSAQSQADLLRAGYSLTDEIAVLTGELGDIPPHKSSAFEIDEVKSAADFRIFLEVYQHGLGVPPHLRGHPAFSHWWTLPGWNLFLARENGTPLAAAILFMEESLAYLATASTIPEYRNRGAQTALLQHRALRAVENGCATIWAQAKPDSTSARNMLRVGLNELCRKQRLVKRIAGDTSE